ncbi:hypothetical protein JW824_14390 [bacterium]|nr:hypothetical protein [bacterium]
MNKIKIISISISLFIILSFSRYTFSQGINHSVGLNVLNSFIFWGNRYPEGSFDNLGIGTFITPICKVDLKNFIFHFNFMFGYLNFTGPNDLTRTGPDDDIDIGFDSNMNRNDLRIQIGYRLSNYINLFIESKYMYLRIKGDSDYKFDWQSSFNYIEKGILLGPGINLNYPEKNSNSFFTLSLSYLIGGLNYNYNSHRLKDEKTYNDNIETQLFSANIGYNFHINKNWLLGISLESNYFFKIKHAYKYTYSSDLWFIGINTSIFYFL